MALDNQETICSRCLFSQKADTGEKACGFGLLQHIKQDYDVLIGSKDGYNIIPKYECRYAFSKNVYDENQSSLGTIEELKQKIIAYNRVPYTLCIYIDNFKEIEYLSHIKDLTILPQHIAIVGRDEDISLIQSNLDGILPDGIPWKCNGFVIETDIYDMVQCGLSTNLTIKQIPFIWFTNGSNLINAINNGVIELINHMIYIQQINSNGILCQSGQDADSDNSDGLFGSFLSTGLWLAIRSYKENDARSFRDIIKALQREYPDMDISEYAY
jgi:hypothetical protein